jgi:hypothetical protein
LEEELYRELIDIFRRPSEVYSRSGPYVHWYEWTFVWRSTVGLFFKCNRDDFGIDFTNNGREDRLMGGSKEVTNEGTERNVMEGTEGSEGNRAGRRYA